MASLFEPVGPLDRRVYWRRRAVVIGVVVVLLLIVLKACGGGGGSSDASNGSPATSTPKSSASSSPSSSASKSSSPKSSPSASSSSTSSTAPIAACKDSDVLVTAEPAKSSYAVGDTVNITYVVSTKNGVTCKRDVGGTADEVRVETAAGSVVWSSDYCSPGGKKDVRTIGPKASFSVLVAWDGNVTTSGCPTGAQPAPAGSYKVLGRNGAVIGPSAKLTLG